MAHIEIWQPLQGDVHGVRATFKQRMEKLYTGWSDDYDEQWDKNSFLFVLKAGQEYKATCRMVIKRYHEIVFKTPMETAAIKSFSLDSYRDICAEGGMVSFEDLKSFGVLMYYVGGWLYENEVDHLFTCYDINNGLIKSLYVDMLDFETLENASLIYEGFFSKKTQKEVEWQVVKSDKDRGKATVDKLMANAGLVYEEGKYPTLKGWLNSIGKKI